MLLTADLALSNSFSFSNNTINNNISATNLFTISRGGHNYIFFTVLNTTFSSKNITTDNNGTI